MTLPGPLWGLKGILQMCGLPHTMSPLWATHRDDCVPLRTIMGPYGEERMGCKCSMPEGEKQAPEKKKFEKIWISRFLELTLRPFGKKRERKVAQNLSAPPRRLR